MHLKSLIVVCLLVSSVLFSQTVYDVETEGKTLETNFNNVIDKADTPFLIGYSIETNESKIFTMGSFIVKKNSHSVSLKKMLNGEGTQTTNNYHRSSISIKSPIVVVSQSNDDNIIPDSETAIFFYYKKASKNISDFSRTYIMNMASKVEVKNIPIYWLGNQKIDHSLDFLFLQYKNSNNSDDKEDLLPPIAVHKKSAKVTPFFIDIVKNEIDNDLREDAVFWLAYQDNNEAFSTLKNIVYSNGEDEDLREEAVMGLAQLTIPEGFQEVAKIAKSCNETFLRREAIMWLGQFAVKKAKDELKDIVENDPKIDLKKQALYALSESDDDMIPYLIDIVNNNNSLKLKKAAIYILGDSDDERAVNALIKLATR